MKKELTNQNKDMKIYYKTEYGQRYWSFDEVTWFPCQSKQKMNPGKWKV